MKKSIFGITLFFLFYACDTPCQEASTGPPNFSIEIIDAVSNENVFSNGTFIESQLQVTSENSTSLDYSFIAENNLNIIIISPAWEKGTFTTNVKLGDGIIIPIVSVIKKVSDDCYTNYVIQSVTINNYDYYYDTENYNYKIKI